MIQPLSSAASQMLAALFLALDARDYAALTDCFTANGVWRRQGQDLKGAAEITRVLETRPPSLVTVHAVSTIAIDERSATTGSARFYLTVFRHDDGTPPSGPVPVPRPAVVGLCTAEFVLNNGRWRIQALQTGPYVFAG